MVMKKMTFQIEERLLWKLFQFIGYSQSKTDIHTLEENSYESQRLEVKFWINYFVPKYYRR